MRLDAHRTALLMIDVQEDQWRCEAPQTPPPDLLPVLERLLAFARQTGIKVIHIRHVSARPRAFFQEGTSGVEFRPGFTPRPGEAVLTKHTPGSFYQTPLEDVLRQAGVENVFVAGLQTHHCCDTTTRESSARGFRTFVVADGVGTFDLTGPDGSTITRGEVQRATLAVLTGFGTVVGSAKFLDPATWQNGGAQHE